MSILPIMNGSQDDCRPNAILAPDGSCIIISKSQTQDSDNADCSDKAETEKPAAWNTLVKGCVATTDGRDPISETSELIVQNHVFAENINTDVNHDSCRP